MSNSWNALLIIFRLILSYGVNKGYHIFLFLKMSKCSHAV